MDGFVISHWVLALDDYIIVSIGKQRSHLAVSIEESWQRVTVYLVQAVTQTLGVETNHIVGYKKM